jgi:ribosomal-protein-alanine N-acetyltransferase
VSGTRFRRMRWWDLDEVVAVEGPSFGADAWSREQVLSELAQGRSRRYLVLREVPGEASADAAGEGRALAADGPLLGYVGVAVHGPDAEVQTLAVAPSARGRGLGRALVTRARAVAREAGARRLGLEVREDDPVAVGLYTGAGFTRSGRRPGYYAARDGGGRTAALLMDTELTDADLSTAGRLDARARA